MEILDRGFTVEEAEELARWRYEPPYDLYNSSGPQTFLHPDYRPVVDGPDLIGFACFGAEARVAGQVVEDGTVDVGAGLRPDLLGQRLGTSLMPLVIEYAQQRLGPRRVRAAVAQFNERSQQVCRSAGFEPVRVFDVPGEGPFVELVLDLAEPLAAYWRGIAAYNAGAIARYAAGFAGEATIVRPDWQGRGRAEIEAMWTRELALFPDRQLRVLTAVAHDEVVLAEWVWSASQVQIRGMEIAHMRDGLIQEYRMYWDHRQVQKQLD